MYSLENAFAALMAKETKNIEMDSGDEFQGIGSTQEAESQVVQDSNTDNQEPDLEELERQLFGQGVTYRMMSWADEADEMDEILPSQSFSHLSDLPSTDSSDGPNGSSPRMRLESCTSLSSISKRSSVLSNQNSSSSQGKSKLTNWYSMEGNLPSSRTEDEEEGGEWIQVKNQLRKQKKRSQTSKSQKQTSNTMQNDENAKKRSRRKMGGRGARRNSNNISPSALSNN